jgi:hypothetical protein
MKLQNKTLLKVDDNTRGNARLVSRKEQTRYTNGIKYQQILLETMMKAMRDRTTHQYEQKPSSARAALSSSQSV